MGSYPLNTIRQYVVTAHKMRFVIVHYHVFKNGGSTIESILEREFPHTFATLHGPAPDSVLDGKHLAAFLRRHPDITAVSSHHLRYPLPSIRNVVLFDCCFLRHPLRRLHSLYTYWRRVDSGDAMCRLARRETPRGFIRHLIEHAPHMASEVQVMQLANSGAFTRPAGEQDLEKASVMVREMAMPGLVEMFDESLVAAEFFLYPAFPAISLEYVAKNVSRPTPAGSLTPEEEFTTLWGADLYQSLVKLNRLDLELFRRTRDEVMRRFSLAPHAERKLEEFRSRCARLRQRTGEPIRTSFQQSTSAATTA